MGSRGLVAPNRVVLDTNIIVSTLIYLVGSLGWLRGAWQTNRILPLRSLETSAELTRIVSYARFGLTQDRQHSLVEEYLPWAEVVQVPDGLNVPQSRDPNEQPFLLLAIAGNADALVTGDNDLLVLAGGFSVPIITPRELKARLFAEL